MDIFDTLTVTSYTHIKDLDSIYLTLENKDQGVEVQLGTDIGSDVYIKNILKITDSNCLDEIVGKTVKCNRSIPGSKIKYLEHLTKPIRMRASRKIEWLPDY